MDGRRVDPDGPVDIRDSSVITIGPFQIVVHLDLVALPVPPSDPDAATSIIRDHSMDAAMKTPAPAAAPLASRDVLRALLVRHEPSHVVARAGEIMWVLADVIVRFRGAVDTAGSPLVSSADRVEIVSYILDPAAGRERATEVRAVPRTCFGSR